MRLDREFFDECNHPWRDVGETFKTYARADASRDNPVRQAQRCRHCDAVRVIVVGYSDKQSPPASASQDK